MDIIIIKLANVTTINGYKVTSFSILEDHVKTYRGGMETKIPYLRGDKLIIIRKNRPRQTKETIINGRGRRFLVENY